MKIQKALSALCVALLVAFFMVCNRGNVYAQGADQAPAKVADLKEDETNLQTQLYLIVGTNQAVPDEKLPAALDGVVKQLRAELPFKTYRLSATLINRVKNEGRLDLSWIGGPLASPVGSASTVTPSFSQFKVRTVKLAKNAAGESVVQLLGFNFGARVPLQVGQVAVNGGVPAINYENMGLSTDISSREGEPVIVGTLNVGPSGDAIILIVAAKRTNR
jgi:hypothetical protein